MKRQIIFIGIMIVFNTLIKAQETSPIKLYCDKKQSTISYSMNHPLHSWTGESTDITSVIVTDENRNIINQVAVLVKISSFDSKNANRDSHAMEVTEALKYPSLSFTSTSIKQVGNKLAVSGILNFHGINQLISFEAEKNTINSKAQVRGSFNIKMTQFKIDPPTLLGLATDDDIKVSFNLIY
jgi:polyisoprenoid-binding protein YceI